MEAPVATVAPASPMTLEQMLALPDDRQVDRELIRGELREKLAAPRNRRQSPVEARVVASLGVWLDTQPEPRGEIVSGEAGFRLRRVPDTGVGVDVAYLSAEVFELAREAAYFEGAPILAVEILSPSDEQEEIDDKVILYLESGVSVVWVIHPIFRTVTVYRPDAEPVLFNASQELSAEPHLPGFRVPVAKLFPG
jgi:Uma2 family endonuclease